MAKLNFKLPTTKLCTVVWHRNGQTQEVLIETPPNNDTLAMRMLQHRVGASEIRAVKALQPSALIGQRI